MGSMNLLSPTSGSTLAPVSSTQGQGDLLGSSQPASSAASSKPQAPEVDKKAFKGLNINLDNLSADSKVCIAHACAHCQSSLSTQSYFMWCCSVQTHSPPACLTALQQRLRSLCRTWAILSLRWAAACMDSSSSNPWAVMG